MKYSIPENHLSLLRAGSDPARLPIVAASYNYAKARPQYARMRQAVDFMVNPATAPEPAARRSLAARCGCCTISRQTAAAPATRPAASLSYVVLSPTLGGDDPA